VEIRDQVPGMAAPAKGALPPQKVDIWGSIKDQDKSMHAFEVMFQAAVKVRCTVVLDVSAHSF
jgi:hypothetical protein